MQAVHVLRCAPALVSTCAPMDATVGPLEVSQCGEVVTMPVNGPASPRRSHHVWLPPSRFAPSFTSSITERKRRLVDSDSPSGGTVRQSFAVLAARSIVNLLQQPPQHHRLLRHHQLVIYLLLLVFFDNILLLPLTALSDLGMQHIDAGVWRLDVRMSFFSAHQCLIRLQWSMADFLQTHSIRFVNRAACSRRN